MVMPKHKTSSAATNSVDTVTNATTGRIPPVSVKFPELSIKKGLKCRALLEDQILLIDVRTMAWGRGDTTV